MTDYSKMTPEQLEKMKAAAAERKGWKGSIADFVDPSTRKNADAATAELERRRKQAEQDAKEAAEIEAAKKAVSQFKFKSGGCVTKKAQGGTIFPPGQDMTDVSPEDVRDAKRRKKETEEYDKRMPMPKPRKDKEVSKFASGGSVRGDGAAQRGKTRGKMC